MAQLGPVLCDETTTVGLPKGAVEFRTFEICPKQLKFPGLFFGSAARAVDKTVLELMELFGIKIQVYMHEFDGKFVSFAAAGDDVELIYATFRNFVCNEEDLERLKRGDICVNFDFAYKSTPRLELPVQTTLPREQMKDSVIFGVVKHIVNPLPGKNWALTEDLSKYCNPDENITLHVGACGQRLEIKNYATAATHEWPFALEHVPSVMEVGSPSFDRVLFELTKMAGVEWEVREKGSRLFYVLKNEEIMQKFAENF